MEKNLPEILFGTADKAISKSLSRLLKAKKIKKIYPRVYTSNLKDSPEIIIKRNLYVVLGKLFPKAVLSHRTAIEGKPAKSVIFLTYKYTKKIIMPGITVQLLKGPLALEDDMPFLEGLYISSMPRSYLENMQRSGRALQVPKTLPKEVVETRLDRICQIHGEERLNQIRDHAREIADHFNMDREFQYLNKIISSLLRTNTSSKLTSPSALARAFGQPYDQDRLELLQLLFSELKQQELPLIKESQTTVVANRNRAFFEAYFSNYIEGTQFEIEEAREIIFDNKVPENRPDDAHDILGAFRIVSDQKEMIIIPESADHLIKLLKRRHEALMGSHPDKSPGMFKEKSNRAGQTHFVSPELVKGTLTKGYEIYRALDHGLSRSIFMMFLVTEAHPFIDGNGRIARIMMNAELVQKNLARIIIPTVYREDYLLALKALSQKKRFEPFIKMMCRAQQFTSEVDFADYDQALETLKKCHAFNEYDEKKLIMPSRLT
jgi:hypothetical protein